MNQPTPSGSTPSALRRELGLLDAVGVGYGAIIGAGIFVVTGIAAEVAGPALLLGLLLAGVAATCNALTMAQLAAAYPASGATYEYGVRLLGPRTGFVAGWMFLSSKLAAAGTVALGLGGYLGTLLPAANPRLLAVGAIVGFTLLAARGIRRSSRANLVIVTISLGSLILFVLAGAGSVQTERLVPFAPAGWRGTAEAAAMLFFAFTGYARIATLAEEVSDPERTLPRAILLTIWGALLLYLAVALVAVGSVGAPALAGSAAPLHAAATTFASPAVAVAVSVGGITAMLGVILSQLLGLSRMAFAMARRGDLPAPLAHVDPRHGVPSLAVYAVGSAAALVAATGTLYGVASAAAFAILVYYLIANLAALRMPRAARLYPDAVPWTGLVACTLLALSLDRAVVLSGIILLFVGLVVRAGLRRIG